MVTLLRRSESAPARSSLDRAVAEAGGEWTAEQDADADLLAAEATAKNARAVHVRGDLGWLAAAPGVEFVSAGGPPDVSALHSLHGLRGLTLLAWKGILDGSSWPRLEWLSASETPKSGGGLESVLPLPTLREIVVDNLPGDDLSGVGSAALESLKVRRSPRVTSLRGADRLTGLRVLQLDGLRNLESLDGLDALAGLEVLHLEALPHVTRLDEVARLPRLRYLDAIDLKTVESLAPLAGHPTLQYVMFPPTADLDPEPLRTIPDLKMVMAGYPRRWKDRLAGLPMREQFTEGDPVFDGWARLNPR